MDGFNSFIGSSDPTYSTAACVSVNKVAARE